MSVALQPLTRPSFRVVIFSDFDGTISDLDSLKFLLNEHAHPEWKNVEKGLASGRLEERIGLQQAFDHLTMPFHEAKTQVLANVKIDPYFKRFAEWVKR